MPTTQDTAARDEQRIDSMLASLREADQFAEACQVVRVRAEGLADAESQSAQEARDVQEIVQTMLAELRRVTASAQALYRQALTEGNPAVIHVAAQLAPGLEAIYGDAADALVKAALGLSAAGYRLKVETAPAIH